MNDLMGQSGIINTICSKAALILVSAIAIEIGLLLLVAIIAIVAGADKPNN